MTIHDAVYVEAPDEETQAARNILKTEMDAAVEMPIVPLEVDIE
jgi:DNA polymerase I-like protein with 3'-5' exonuclease and polymerase domains